MLKGIFLSWSEKMLLFSRPVMPNSLWPHGLQHASLSLTISWSLPKFMSIALVIPSSHLILWHPLLLLPSIFPSIRDFSNESAVHIRWPQYWSFNFSVSPSSKYSWLISLKFDLFELLAVQGTLRNLLQHHNLKVSILLIWLYFQILHFIPLIYFSTLWPITHSLAYCWFISC